MDQTYETRRRSGKRNGSLEPKKPESLTGALKVQSLAPESRKEKTMNMQTAKALGFKKGDFVHTGAFPGIVIGDAHTRTPTCEVWGMEHEMGSAYADDLVLLNWPSFKALAERYGFDEKAYSEVAKEAIKNAKARTSAQEVPVTA
jgi:hypothetical protein